MTDTEARSWSKAVCPHCGGELTSEPQGVRVGDDGLRAALEQVLAEPTGDMRTSASRALFEKAAHSKTSEVTVAAQQLRVLLPAIEGEAVTLVVRAVLAAQPTSRPRVVCICGSTRFAEHMNAEAERLTLAGAIVVRPEVVAYSRNRDQQFVEPEVKAALDELHLRKIDLADEVVVVTVSGYIGESTRREIAYAEQTGRPVRYATYPAPMTTEEYDAAIAAMVCPPCQQGSHWNHVKPDGACNTIDRVHNHECPCEWRPA